MNNQAGNTQSNDGTWYILRVISASGSYQLVQERLADLPDSDSIDYTSYEKYEKEIDEAEAAFKSLDTEQQDQVNADAVDNLNKLVEKVQSYRKLKAFKATIKALPRPADATLDHMEAIRAAQREFEEIQLDPDLRDSLSVAETKKMNELIETIDNLLWQDAIDKIDAIGEVTLESGDAIKAARAAYDALTDTQKELVKNYEKLLAAEELYEELTASAAAIAQKAAEEAKAAQKAAEEARKSAEDAKSAAELAMQAAEQSNKEAAASAAQAAEYAKKMAEAYEEIVRIKAELVEYLAKAQAEAERAEAERKAAEEAQRKAEEAALAAAKYAAAYELAQLQQNGEGLTGHAKEAYDKALADAAAAIEAAKTPAEVDAALAAAREALNNALCPSAAFTDVEENVWYHDGIDFMVRNGYMNGVAADTFDVEGSLTRAQLVTILYRAAGSPSVSGVTNPFKDTKSDYYTNAMLWAYKNSIVTGTSATTFSPDSPVTREQIAAILYRYMGSPTATGSLTGFTDRANVSTYATTAMQWAIGKGYITGIGTKLDPKGNATRAQVATILSRYAQNIVK